MDFAESVGSNRNCHVFNLHAYTSLTIYDNLPCQQQLGVEIKAEAEGLLKMEVNKKHHLTDISGTVMQHMFYICVCYLLNGHDSLPVLLLLYYVVTLKDTTNIQTEVAKADDSLQAIVATVV